jgi:hypothetical protein
VQNALALRALDVEHLVRQCRVVDQVARAHVIGSSPTWNRVYQMVPHSSGFSGSEVQPRTDSLPKSGFAG